MALAATLFGGGPELRPIVLPDPDLNAGDARFAERIPRSSIVYGTLEPDGTLTRPSGTLSPSEGERDGVRGPSGSGAPDQRRGSAVATGDGPDFTHR